ncbi:MAG: glucan biosynthesis protein, partial [Rhodovulum sp.]
MTRRRTLAALAGTAAAAALLPPIAAAQQAEPMAMPPAPFSFDALAERMRALAATPYRSPPEPEGVIAGLDYDAYRRIRFRPDHARWAGTEAAFRLHAFHPGWLYKAPVTLYEVVDGTERQMAFSAEDFEYDGALADRVPAGLALPTVAGFRLHAPLNRADIFDEVVVFLGASYFRALGRGNVYGLSARGLAINTATGKGEEFPRFSAFWIERPAPGADHVTLHAALDSPSATGAFRFVVRPGENTVIDVTARLFLREDVAQLGVAPLTSMYLLGDNDHGTFDDFRPRVHDSEVLVLNTRGGETFVRPLNNPPRLASSYLGTRDPVSFGLVQRDRAFDSYLDAGAHYE